MVNILYSVCGIGLGHAVRSTQIIKELKKDHELVITSYSSGYKYLKKLFPETKKIDWFELHYDGEKLDKSLTLISNLNAFPTVFVNNVKQMIPIARKFKPDIIITDFDVNAIYLGNLFRVPVVTISNMHLMQYIKPKLELRNMLKFYFTEMPVLKAFAGSNYFFISSILQPKVKHKKNTYFFKPLLREEVEKLKIKNKGHSLVYLRRQDEEKLIEVLTTLKKPTIVYTTLPGENPKYKNNLYIKFKKFNEKEFLKDLANASEVFSHGGISLLYESYFLKKPLCVIADENFFERYYNGYLVKKSKIGTMLNTVDESKIQKFLKNRGQYLKEYKKIQSKSGNKDLIEKLNEIIQKEMKK